MINLQNARRYEDLLGADVESAPYEFALLFQADGWLARKRAKGRFKMLRAIDPKLRPMLRYGERVYFVTSGTTASALEQFFVGAMAQTLNRRALVFTTERVLLLQIDSHKRPRELVAQISYASIVEVKATWSGYCRLTLRNHEKLNFIGVPKADRKNLAALLADLVRQQGGAAPLGEGGPALELLCPHCFAAVPGHPERCPHCQGRFKLAQIAMLRSLLFPGLGDLYLGHRAFAVFEMIGAAMVWFTMVIAPLVGVPDENGKVARADASYWAAAIVMLAIVHGVDAVMTRRFALKGHYPART